MAAWVALVLGLALIDSINPSAIAVTLYLLLSRTDPGSRVLAYVAGIFSTYLLTGCLLLLGLQAVTVQLRDAWYSDAAYVVEGLLGAALLVYSFFAPAQRPRSPVPTARGHAGLFLLGAGISVVEFSTALPYLGVIGLITRAGLDVQQWLPLMFIYNVVMVLPPVALLLAYRLAGARVRQRMQRWDARLRAGARGTWLWIVGIVGFLLLADAITHFVLPGRAGSSG
ncbi:GAP family protein [Kineococcus sp. TBRC 1896]|uniref:GAP family protein n=1 Tax=Kineococcus mangrovi TaxID=1660183 RepID=A0ABV4I984_9ACTN